jgi:hypothetical protein
MPITPIGYWDKGGKSDSLKLKELKNACAIKVDVKERKQFVGFDAMRP